MEDKTRRDVLGIGAAVAAVLLTKQVAAQPKPLAAGAKRKYLSITVGTLAGNEALLEKVTKAVDTALQGNGPAIGGVGPVSEWSQDGGWYRDLTGGGWSQSGGWVRDLNGSNISVLSQTAAAQSPALTNVRTALKQVSLGTTTAATTGMP